MIDWISRSGCGWALTLNPNRSLGLETELEIVKSAFRDADKHLLGHRFKQVDGRNRMLGFVVAEHVDSNLHFHIALRPGRPASEVEEAERCSALAVAWELRVISGTSHLTAIKTADGWGRYISKEFRREGFEFWPSSFWWPERQRRHVLDRSWVDRHGSAGAV
nr:hypothetical protein [Brevundimonas subvibrioides]